MSDHSYAPPRNGGSLQTAVRTEDAVTVTAPPPLTLVTPIESGRWRRRVLPAGLLCDPRLHPVAQDLQRQRAAEQELVMKCANVEALTQRRLRFLAQRAEAQLADFVSE